MTKRQIAKLAANIVVGTAIGSFVTKAILANAPATEKFKTAEMTGMLVGSVAASKLRPTTDKLVDDWFDRRTAAKTI
jgi:hypothetical protein